jgi:hypothetical protein
VALSKVEVEVREWCGEEEAVGVEVDDDLADFGVGSLGSIIIHAATLEMGLVYACQP